MIFENFENVINTGIPKTGGTFIIIGLLRVSKIPPYLGQPQS
jgi:hypothetical protein